jgi:hypoxanthine phosphoribosyltransferase
MSERIVTMLSAKEIAARVHELGAEITKDYKDRPIVLVCVLKGSFVFGADLMRAIDLPLRVDFLGVRSYGEGTETSGVVQITQDLSRPIEHEDVILVEDIVDTGLTSTYVLGELRRRGPSSVDVCTLFDRRARRIVPVPVRFAGFEAPDELLLGYGLDVAGRYRNLRFVATGDREALEDDPEAHVQQLYGR